VSELLVELRDLSVTFPRGLKPVVSRVSLHIDAGECLALVGESGSGKTLTALSLLGLIPEEARVETKTLKIAGVEAGSFSQAQWRSLRGTRVGLVSQDALVSLDPLRKVEAEVGEVVALSRPKPSRARIAKRVVEALELASVPEPHSRKQQYPHELSGGLAQRALIASAIAGNPRILIADEPTTALDSINRARILSLLATLKAEGMALLLVSHDIGLVRDLADRIAVMRDGEIVECAPTRALLQAPQHPYTRELLEAIPTTRHTALGRNRSAEDHAPLALSCSGLKRSYISHKGSVVRALDGVSFEVPPGRTMGIVGESGSGKTTLARILMGLEQPDSGSVVLGGEPWSPGPEKGRRTRRGRIQLVEQNPDDALDPRWRVGKILREALALDSSRESPVALDQRVTELLHQVGLSADLLNRRPRQLSGGQKQRVAIARALARRPSVLVCDEPVSALDALVQAQILALLTSLQKELGLTLIVISHDLVVIGQLSDEILVMQEGRIVESGPLQTVMDHPQHSLTKALLAASQGILS
jgi:peptide/nickel transport system ATP-binding protein